METQELAGDDTRKTEPEHFTEFANVQQMAAALEGEPTQPAQAGYQPPEPVHVSGAEVIAPIVSLACGLLAPNWNIGTEEQQALSESYGALVDKYFPEGASAFGVELNALLITAAIITPRLGTPRKSEPQDVKTNAAKEEQANAKETS